MPFSTQSPSPPLPSGTPSRQAGPGLAPYLQRLLPLETGGLASLLDHRQLLPVQPCHHDSSGYPACHLSTSISMGTVGLQPSDLCKFLGTKFSKPLSKPEEGGSPAHQHRLLRLLVPASLSSHPPPALGWVLGLSGTLSVLLLFCWQEGSGVCLGMLDFQCRN